MSRANLLALGLAVAGLGFVLFGVLAFSAPLLDGPDALLRFIAQTFPPGQGPPPLLAALLRQAPYLFWLVGVAFCSAPGFLLISLAALIRLKVARPRELEDLRQADAGSAREALLQWLVRECVEGSGEDAAGRAARIYGAATRTVGDLDPERRTRFRLFLREAGLEPEGFEVSHAEPAPTPSNFELRRLWARLLVLALSIAAVLVGLWGLLVFVFLDRMVPVLRLYVPPHQDAMILAFAWLVAALLVLAAVGVWGLSRLDRKAERRGVAGFAESCDHLLAGTRECLERIVALHRAEPAVAARLVRGSILAGLRGLDAGRKRALIEGAREAGVLGAGLDLGSADLRSADLSGLDLPNLGLRAAHLSGATLAEANLAQSNLEEADLRSADLRGANLRLTVLRGARMERSCLHHAFLAGADLSGAHLDGASFWHADLSRTDLSRASVLAAQLEEARSLAGALLPDGLASAAAAPRTGA